MQFAAFVLPLVLLQSGGKLEKKDTKVGTGPAAEEYDLLTMDYTGKLKDGTVFDSSKKPGHTPFQFVIGGGMVIKGWDQGILGMKVGGVRTLVIPPDLGYGDHAAPGGAIPANSTLTFEVELKAIHKCDYTIVTKGTGNGAKAGDSIQCNVVGKLASGTAILGTKEKPISAPVTLGRTPMPFQGLAQAFYGMKLGEKRTVKIPSEFALGTRSTPQIPANSGMVFEIELVKFLK